MKKPLRAALLSAFAFPGAGHFSIKKSIQAWLLLGMSTICFLFIMAKILEVARMIADRIVSGAMPLDVEKIRSLISESIYNNSNLTMPITILVICWLVGIVDSYRLAWLMERKADTKEEKN